MFSFILYYDTSGFKHRTKWLCILHENGYVRLSGFKRSFYSFLVRDCHQQQRVSFLDKVLLISSSVLAERYAYNFEKHTETKRQRFEGQTKNMKSGLTPHLLSTSISTEQMSWFH